MRVNQLMNLLRQILVFVFFQDGVFSSASNFQYNLSY